MIQPAQEMMQQIAILSQQMTLLSQKLVPPATSQQCVRLVAWMEEWFSHKRRNISPKTHEDYYGLYCRHILTYFGDCQLSSITAAELEHFYFYLLDTKGLSPGTVNKIKASILGAALRKAYGQQLIAFNPTVGLEPIKDNSQHHQPYTLEELKLLVDASRRSYHWIAPLLMIGTGMRRCELLGLRWDDFNSERRTLHIVRDYVSTSHESYLTCTKTDGSKRLVVIPPELCHALQRYRANEGRGKTYIISQQNADKPVNPHNFSRSYRRWCEAAGIPKEKQGGHSTRATYCTMASEAGCTLDGIRRQVGHTDFRMLLQVYIHERTHEKQYAVADRMGEAFAPLFSDLSTSHGQIGKS